MKCSGSAGFGEQDRCHPNMTVEPKDTRNCKIFGFDTSRCPQPKQNHMKNKGSTEDKYLYVIPLKGVILTKDNLMKRNWQGSEKCCFCHKNETIKHIFFEYRFTWVIWDCIQVALNLA
jgi:hypothetical protein